MKALFDTTMLIHLLKGDTKAIETSEQLRKQNVVLYTTVINIYEVSRGIKLKNIGKDEHHLALNNLTKNLNILLIDLIVAETASLIYGDLRKKGMTIDEPDYLVAGACISNGIETIVTKNEKHFKHIKGLKVLTY